METNNSKSFIGKSNTTVATKLYNIPLDVLIDIIKNFINNEMEYKIMGTSEQDNSLMIQMRIEKNNNIHFEAQKNIETILTDYEYYISKNDELF